MARKRLIDTEDLYFDTELVGILGVRGLHLYIRLWGIAEDWGGYEARYSDIALKMGALKFKTLEVEKTIQKLTKNNKILEYQKGNKTIHWIVNLMKHQPLDNPSPPKLPLPDWITVELLEYKSGKKYAKYSIIPEKLPVGYQSATSRLPETEKRNVTVTNSNSKETTEFFDYFLLKTKKDFKLTPERVKIIEGRIKDGFTYEQLKQAVDNFVQDDWEGRAKLMDIVYCIGIRNKIDNLEKWLNYKPQEPQARKP